MLPEAGGHTPVLALEIEREIGMPPDQTCRERYANALACIGRSDDQYMFVAVMSEKLPIQRAQNDAIAIGELQLAGIARSGPAGAAIRGGVLGFPRTPE
jgi:hypothetical protein